MEPAVRFLDSADGLSVEQLGHGFFDGWPQRPTPETHLRLLRGSDHVALALAPDSDEVVGFATALSDGVLCAFIPLLEVLPAWRGRGIGSALIERLRAGLEPLYAIDVVCDPELQPFYERATGFRSSTAMSRRDYAMQAGRPETD